MDHKHQVMNRGFVPIRIKDYVNLCKRNNPGIDITDLTRRLKYALNAHRNGTSCECGEPIWIVGSAETGLACFTCITLEAMPDSDYEICGE